MISPTIYLIICAVLSVAVLLGISLMSKVKTAVLGNTISALSVFAGIVITLLYNQIISVSSIYIYMLVGIIVGSALATRVKMIQMPQLVALLNGIGGLASALVGILSLLGVGQLVSSFPVFSNVTAVLAIVIGVITLVGSLVAAGKLHKLLPQRPVIWKNHSALLNVSLLVLVAMVLYSVFAGNVLGESTDIAVILLVGIVVSALFGYAFSIRVGGADMPITISLLNSLSGVAGAIAGMAIGDILLVSVGGIVGASGLFLTQIMCRSMNRSLMDILTGKTSAPAKKESVSKPVVEAKVDEKGPEPVVTQKTKGDILRAAKSVIIVPGYGMALAQAQHLVRQLADKLEANGAEVRYAIHPVAGRMPGHMNVLLAEADVSYEQLYEMDAINDDFKNTDAVIVIGANDVLNPAARDAVDTPIYGMPVLNVDEAKEVFICNYDLNPGYAGMENPLYKKTSGIHLLLGDAKESVSQLLSELDSKPVVEQKEEPKKDNSAEVLQNAKSVIIVPGYGMALAQAQHLVRQLADKLEANGADVRYAIHPVAGRMPGHMNVLLAEADVSYEQLYEMDAINDDFKNTDAVIVIGANDVLNPAARDAVDTPIYGMPVLNVDEAKEVFICNYDLNPGYAGVENPLYKKSSGIHLLLGDAKESISQLLSELDGKPVVEEKEEPKKDNSAEVLQNAKSVIIVPGYGMALAQAQHLVRQLADKLEANGADVRYAIHPVAGRMPGHMNVLLAEADVSYEQLYEMDAINDDFKNTDAVIVIGANDVLNPAARDAVDTPIYGMPVLNVDEAKEVFICNYDLNPGYAGVENPLYKKTSGIHLLLGDAKESLQTLMDLLN